MERLGQRIRRVKLVSLVFLVVFRPGLLQAAEEAAKHAEPGIVNLNISVLIQVVNFLILIALLAEKLSCDKVFVVHIIDYLSEHGYVKRIQNTHDRRKYGLVVTSKARKLIPNIISAWRKTNAILLNNLSEKQINDLYSSLMIIESNLSSYRNQPEF